MSSNFLDDLRALNINGACAKNPDVSIEDILYEQRAMDQGQKTRDELTDEIESLLKPPLTFGNEMLNKLQQ